MRLDTLSTRRNRFSTSIPFLAAWVVVGWVVAAGTSGPLSAQQTSQEKEPPPGVTIAEAETELSSIESSSSLSDTVKDRLRSSYKTAIDLLKKADANKARTAKFARSIETGPAEVESLGQQLAALPSVEQAAEIDPAWDVQELQKEVASRRIQLTSLQGDLSKAATELTRIKGRPDQINDRLPKAIEELDEVRDALAASDNTGDVDSIRRADQLLLKSREAALESESEMLKQEQLSQLVRADLAQATHALLERKVENDNAQLDALVAMRLRKLTKSSDKIAAIVDAAKGNVPEGDQGVQELVAELEVLSKEFDHVVELTKFVSTAQASVSFQTNYLDREYESLQEQLTVEGDGRAMAQVLFDLQDQLLNPAHQTSNVTGKVPKLDETRLAYLRSQQTLRGHPAVEQRFRQYDSLPLKQLIDMRKEVLEKLRLEYSNLISALTALDTSNQQLLNRADRLREFISQELFWIRSSPPVSIETVSEIPPGLSWFFGSGHWTEFARALVETVFAKPIRCILLFALVVALCVLRPWIIASLERTGVEIRRVSSARYSMTFEALVRTVLLAIPIPLVLWFLGWATRQIPDQSAWLRGLSLGLNDAFVIALVLMFLESACRPCGLAAAHFNWNPNALRLFRRTVIRFGVVYVPAHLLVSSTLYGDASQYSDSVGRVCFVVAHLFNAMLIWQLFRAPNGILATIEERDASVSKVKLAYVIFGLLMALPVCLVALAWQGYMITAIELSLGLLATLGVCSVGVFSYWLAIRWFALKGRKLALAVRLESWRARLEAAESGAQDVSDEVVATLPEDEEELDLEAISKQTRRLLRSLITLTVLVTIVLFWSKTIPLITVLEQVHVPLTGGMTALAVVQAALIITVTIIAVKNLPGALELAVLRATSIESGTRYAVVTLCRYALIAIGVLAFSAVLQIDWAKFGWIAAALSVGLGFGMQEVVTNFVCGIILLFERPVRVGDVVTVEGTTGTVTKIRMRATTITNWDRQELVVPNKNLITNTILNWTLTGTTSRIVITVGAAHGTDTELAREILLNVANDHPAILSDPSPLATFEQFADSSLTLCLRAYVPDLGSRLRTMTELHTEIDKRFAEAGIEIALPQQEIRLRGGLGRDDYDDMSSFAKSGQPTER